MSDYSDIFRAAALRYGPDNVTDKTYDEYPREGNWKSLKSHIQKFEVDIQDTDITAEELTSELQEYGYRLWRKGDGRFEDNICDYKFIVAVTEESEPVPHDNDN